MNILNQYFRRADGKVRDTMIHVTTRACGGVTAVYLDGIARTMLDSDFGAGITLELEDVESWMADYRHSEFWCRPEFGTGLDTVPDETQGLICKKTDGTFAVVLPVVSEKYKCVLCGEGENTVTAKGSHVLSTCDR